MCLRHAKDFSYMLSSLYNIDWQNTNNIQLVCSRLFLIKFTGRYILHATFLLSEKHINLHCVWDESESPFSFSLSLRDTLSDLESCYRAYRREREARKCTKQSVVVCASPVKRRVQLRMERRRLSKEKQKTIIMNQGALHFNIGI